MPLSRPYSIERRYKLVFNGLDWEIYFRDRFSPWRRAWNGTAFMTPRAALRAINYAQRIYDRGNLLTHEVTK